jgi:hypothetical protein
MNSFLSELETIPNPVKLDNLDENIELLKKKKKLASQLYSQYNIEGAIQCLENRKKLILFWLKYFYGIN